MEFRNGLLLQLIECIESTQNEVKRKMIATDARNAAPKSPARLAYEKSSRHIAIRARLFFFTRCVSASVSKKHSSP
jgi:hypothetical protein